MFLNVFQMASPTAFSPHAQRSMAAVMQQQQFASQNLYMKGADSWRPTFSEGRVFVWRKNFEKVLKYIEKKKWTNKLSYI